MAKKTTPTSSPSLLTRVRRVTDPAGRELSVLNDSDAREMAHAGGEPVHQIYRRAFTEGIWPYRYIRNHGTLSLKEQARLADTRVAVIGCGGLGGTVLHLLARMGIGILTLVDHDVFDESNLNRQLVSRNSNIGQSKAMAAKSLVAEINPGVMCKAHATRLTAENAETLLADQQVVVDALDNVGDRLIMAQVCRRMGIPLVHGAIAGLGGQAMTIFPDDTGLDLLYGAPPETDDPRRPEAVLGVPALMPSLIATLQAAEVIKIVLKRGQLFRNRLLHIDLESAGFEFFSF